MTEPRPCLNDRIALFLRGLDQSDARSRAPLTLTIPCFIVVKKTAGRRWFFRDLKVVAGPTTCKVTFGKEVME